MSRGRSNRRVCYRTALLAGIAVALARFAHAEDDFTKKPVVYTMPGMEKARVQSGRYRTKDNLELPFDVYSPPGLGPGERRPAVVLVHGGPVPPDSTPHQMGVFRSYGQLIAASGLVAVAFTHRLYDAGDYPRAEGDVMALVAHVRERASELGIDSSRVAVWAFSGGGPLTSFVFRDSPPYIRCVILYYALLDFAGAPPVYAKVPVEMSVAQALRSASGPFPPVLLARAGLDDEFMKRSVDTFVTAANEKGASIDLLTLAEGHHGFDILDDQPRSREVIQATLAFLRGRLSGG